MVTKKQKKWIETGIVMGAGALVLGGLILGVRGKPDMGDDVVTPLDDITNNDSDITTKLNIESSDAISIGFAFDMDFYRPVAAFDFLVRGSVRVTGNPSVGWASYALHPVFASTSPGVRFTYNLNEPPASLTVARAINGHYDAWTLIGTFRNFEMTEPMNIVTITAKLRTIMPSGIIKDYTLWKKEFSVHN